MSFQYKQPSEEEIELMQKYRDRFEKLEKDMQEDVPASRELSLALTKLEEAAFWFNKGITHND